MKRNSAPAPIWSTLSLPDTLARLRVDASQGLIAADVEARAQRYGPNALHGHTGQGDRRILLDQLGDLPTVILLLAALTAAVAGGFREAAAMVAVVALNALLGVVQTRRAGWTLAALRAVAGPDVRVRREGQTQSVAAAQLVPGDIVLLEAGRPAPADGRLIEVAGLRIREAILTGEPAPVEKITAAIPGPDVALSYQRNMVFMGTTVVSGRGRMVVTETGVRTQLGRAAGALQEIAAPRPPSQRRLARLGRDLALVTCLLVGLVDRHRRAAGCRARPDDDDCGQHGGRGLAYSLARGHDAGVGARRPPHVQAPGAHPHPASRRDSRRGHRDLCGQDRRPD